MLIQERLGWFRKTENIITLAIIVVVLVTHLAVIPQVKDPIYDGMYYVAEANIINQIGGCEIDEKWVYFHYTEGYETQEEWQELGYFQHVPLSKLFIATGIRIFGDNPWGWRVFPALFGVLSILLFYLICQKLTDKRWIPLAATFIFAFENMCFIMSSIAMLDAIAFTFMLAAFLAYLRGNYILAGVMLAFTGTAKTMMVLGGGVILVHWFFVNRKSAVEGIKFIVAAPLAYVILLPLFDYVALREFIYPWDSIYNWFNTTGGGCYWGKLSPEFLAKYSAIHPWNWVTKPNAMIVWPDVYRTDPAYGDPTYEITASWTLWVLIIPAMIYVSYEAIRHRWNSLCLFALLWFVWLYLPWFLIDLAFHKVSYAFHYYPVVGSVCMALGYVVWKLLSIASVHKNRKIRLIIGAPAVIWLAAHFIMFWIMAPIK